jgi:MoaA/NifB/PqqE/SkfB family radical SAM enzyme
MNILEKKLYRPLHVHMVVTRRCNLSCKYCNEFDNKSAHIPLTQLKKQIDKLEELGALSVSFTGGEPLLHPDLVELISYSKKRLDKVSFITNCYLLTKEKILQLNDSRLNKIQISIDGVKPNEKTKKALKNIKEKLILLRRYAKFKVNINSVIGATDPNDVLEVIKFSNKLNFDSTIGFIHDSRGQIKLSEDERKSYYSINMIRKRPMWDILHFSNYEKKLLDDGECPFNCRAGSSYLYVDEFGNVNWCSQKRGVFQKPLMDYTFDDLKEQFHTPKECSKRCTLGCARKLSSLPATFTALTWEYFLKFWLPI